RNYAEYEKSSEFDLLSPEENMRIKKAIYYFSLQISKWVLLLGLIVRETYTNDKSFTDLGEFAKKFLNNELFMIFIDEDNYMSTSSRS
ncbi:14858_t:CDS:2, partial [Funneliformis geosporum]